MSDQLNETVKPDAKADRKRTRRAASWLLLLSFVSMFVGAITWGASEKAGGLDLNVISFPILMMAGLGAIVGFVRCPRRNYVCKVMTFVFLWPSLIIFVNTLCIAIGRIFLPGFGHC